MIQINFIIEGKKRTQVIYEFRQIQYYISRFMSKILITSTVHFRPYTE